MGRCRASAMSAPSPRRPRKPREADSRGMVNLQMTEIYTSNPMPRRFALGLVLLLTAANTPLVADPTPEKVFGWLSLRGDSVPTRYSPGSLDRAANVQWRLEIVMKALGRAGVKIDGINLYLASPEEWQASGCARPYGLPETFGSTLMLPAWGTDRTVALWSELVGAAPSGDGSMPIRGTPEEAGSLVWTDILAQVEAARVGLRRAEVRATAPWVLDLLAHLVALAAYEREEPGRLAALDGFFATLSARVATAIDPARPLPELATAERLAAEARFFAMAREVSRDRRGGAAKLANHLLDWGRKYEGTIPAGELSSRVEGSRQAYDRAFASPGTTGSRGSR